MKPFLGLLAILVGLLTAGGSVAGPAEGLAINNFYATTNVTSTAFLQLVASTVKGIVGMTVLNLGTAPVQIALGASGSEVVQMVVPAQSGSTASPTFYPLSAGYGSRLSVETIGSNNTTGTLQINLFYN